MPPKKQAQAGGSKKAEQKKKEKIIEDKTFGLKNKKGAKQQKFIKAVTHQVKFGQQNPRQGFPGGAVVESPPADAGDTGSCPGPGRSHMPWSGWALCEP
uniref:Zinc finger CCCH-type containing 15 n=1 Tax=Monodon monoceros TaxID=40151 RepID=A0A8C6B5Q3_MONMO